MNPDKTSKEQAKMPRFMLEGRRSCTIFCTHTLCMNYVTITFLLVSSSVESKQLLCFVQGQNIQQRTLSSFITILLY